MLMILVVPVYQIMRMSVDVGLIPMVMHMLVDKIDL